MPKCLECGNSKSFGSSYFPPEAPTANGPISSLIVNFDEEGYVDEMESFGANIDEAQEAWENPDHYFNTCYFCGSTNVEW
jgi:hypothetical protein